MTDKTLVCRDCGSEFVFSVGEQEFYQEKGFTNEPTRCIACRRAKKLDSFKVSLSFIKNISIHLKSQYIFSLIILYSKE